MFTAADHDPLTYARIRREYPRLWPNRRPLIRLAHDADADRLRLLDAELETLTAHRRACVDRLRAYRLRLYPRAGERHHRRHRLAADPPMPPAPADADPVNGVALRRIALAILSRHGALPLRELHGLLHRYGYVIDSPRPVQRLADAMAYEVRHQRARRVARGVYGASRLPVGVPGYEAEAARLGAPLPWEPPGEHEPGPPPVDADALDDPGRWSAEAWPTGAHPGGEWCEGEPDRGVRDFIEELDEVVTAARRRMGELVLERDADRRRIQIRDQFGDRPPLYEEMFSEPFGNDSSTIRSRWSGDEFPAGGASAAEGSELGDDLG